MRLRPAAIAAKINALCDMDLSPGMAAEPLKGPVGANSIGCASSTFMLLQLPPALGF
jgi:hypothetical protein